MSLTAPVPSPSPSSHNSFNALLRAYRDGSDEAGWLLVQRFQRMMLAIANEKIDRELLRREGASDIVMETIIEAQEDLDGFAGQTEPELRAWLKQVLLRNIFNLRRRNEAKIRDIHRDRPLDGEDGQGCLPIVDPGESPSEPIIHGEEVAALKAAIRELPPASREVIYLRYQKGMAYEEIALLTGRSEMATRKLWSRSLQVLSQKLRDRIS